MLEKSIAILGKGPSVARCTKEFIDSFDEVAICGRPIFDGYEEIIGRRAHWDFANESAVAYSSEMRERLGNPIWINTDDQSPYRKEFTEEYSGWFAGGPSTGTFAFDWFVKKSEYTKIALIGFDLFPKGESLYYFKREEWNPNMEYLFHNGTFSEDGRMLIDSLHDTKMTYKYMNEMFDKFNDKKFYIITDYPFEEKPNLKIVKDANGCIIEKE